MTLKIDIIGSNTTWEIQQIMHELKKRGADTLRVDPQYISYDIQKSDVKMFYRDRSYEVPDVALLRGGVLWNHWTKPQKPESYLFFHILTKLGCAIVNFSNFMYQDKVNAAIAFALNNIPHPRTLVIKHEALLERIDFSPVVVKKNRSSLGKGVRKTEKVSEISDFENSYEFYQEYLEQGSTDIRVFVIGERALGAMQRTASNGEWRSNVALGASAKVVPLTNELKKIALQAARAVDYEIAGVDLIPDASDKNQYYVIEVNRAPQFKAFSECTGINVAEEIAKYLIAKVKA